MKANEAPEKIYLNWVNYPLEEIQVEYTRTDVIVEKLECWMNENFYQYAGEFAEGILAQFDRTEDAIDSFRNYMKGE